MVRFIKVHTTARKTPVLLSVTAETSAAFKGEVVNSEGRAVAIRKPFAIHLKEIREWQDGSSISYTTTIIPKHIIESVTEMKENLKYGTLEEIQ